MEWREKNEGMKVGKMEGKGIGRNGGERYETVYYKLLTLRKEITFQFQGTICGVRLAVNTGEK